MFSRIRHAPVASKLSSASPIGSMKRWQELHTGLLLCISIRSRVVRRRPLPASGLASKGGTFGGGGGGGDPISTDITHLPRSTGEVRSAIEVSFRKLPWLRIPRRRGSGYVTRRN